MKRTKYQKIKNSLIILGIVSFFLYMFRLWILLIPSVAIIIVLAVALVMVKRNINTEEISEPITETVSIPQENDVISLAYSVILKRIGELVESHSPNSKWVWKESDSKRRIADGEEVFIILNKAVGYKEAKVIIKNLCVTGLEFVVAKEVPKSDMSTDEEMELPSERTENYELVAFEWVEGHIIDLNNRCNNEIGLGNTELILVEDELPIKESWSDICNELKKQGLVNIELVPQGIKIILT